MHSSFDMACRDYTNNDLEVNIRVNSENLLPSNHNSGGLRVPPDPSWPKVPQRKTVNEPGNVINHPCIVELVGNQNKSRTVLHPPQYRPVSSHRATSNSNSSLKSHIPLLSTKKPGESDPRFKKTQKIVSKSQRQAETIEKPGENRRMESIGIQTVTNIDTKIESLDLPEEFTFKDNRSDGVINNEDFVHKGQNYSSQNPPVTFQVSDKSVYANLKEVEIETPNDSSKTEKDVLNLEEKELDEKNESNEKKIMKCESSQIDSVIKSVDKVKAKICHQQRERLCESETGISLQSLIPRPTRSHNYSMSNCHSDLSADTEPPEIMKYDETSYMSDLDRRQKSFKTCSVSYKKAVSTKKVNCFNCKDYGEALDSYTVCDCHFKEIMQNLNSLLDTTDSIKLRRQLKSEHNLSTFETQQICCRKSRFKTTRHKKSHVTQLSKSQNDILQSDLTISKTAHRHSKYCDDNDSTDVCTSDFETRSVNEIPLKTQKLLNKSYLDYYNKIKSWKVQTGQVKMTKKQDADQQYFCQLAMGAPSNKKRRPNGNSFDTKSSVPEIKILQQCTVLSSMINQDLNKPFPEDELDNQKETNQTDEKSDDKVESNVKSKLSNQKIKSTRRNFRMKFTKVKHMIMCLMIIYCVVVIAPIVADLLLFDVPDAYDNIGYTEFIVQFVASSFQEAYGQYFQMIGKTFIYPVFSVLGFSIQDTSENSR